MHKPIQIAIPQPCHEKWEEMAPADKGRFCAACQKNVVDFTKASDREIAEALRSNKNLCGRFSPYQLERDLVVPKEKSTVWTAVAASVISFITLGSYKVSAQETVKTEQTSNNYETVGILTGIVSDKNDVLADVSIINKTKNDTTISLLSGDYEILADKGDIIEFSLAGYKTRTITVKSGYHKNIKLKRDKSYLKNTSEKESFIITGIISDSAGPLPGANIVNLSRSVIRDSDIEGKFKMTVFEGDVIEVQYVGYETYPFTVKNKEYDILLYESTPLECVTIDVYGGIKVRRTFFGRIFHSIGNLFR